MSGADVRVRSMRAADLSHVRDVERAAFSMPWSEKTFRGLLRRADADLWVAECGGGRIIGLAVFWAVVDEGELGDLAVAPEWRRRGIATRLLEAVLARARDRGVRSLFLEVRPSNEPARRFYRTHGFAAIDRRAGYYRRPVEDALVLRKRLDA